MNEEVSLEYAGKLYTAEYSVIGDTVTTYLPDGSSRSAELRGLNPETAVKTHLRVYAKSLS